MPIDDRTPNRNYQLPNAGNFLSEDVARLRDALTAIDADVFARYTKAETDQKLADLINGAPGALDTLNELAAAMGNDANFAATITTALGNRYTKAEIDALLLFTQNGAGAVARTITSKLKDVVSVKDFGAVGNGVANDTAAIQAAINTNPGRTIYFPTGKYLITNTLNITQSNTFLEGENAGNWYLLSSSSGSVIICNNAINAVHFSNATAPTDTLHGCGVRNLAISRTQNVASGAGLLLTDVSTFTFENVLITEFYNCLRMVGATNCRFNNLSLYTGTCFTGAANSSLLKIEEFNTATPENAGWINSFNQCTFSSELKSDRCIDITGGDDIRFSNSYVSGAKFHAVLLEQIQDVPFYTISFDQVYFDGIAMNGNGTNIGIFFKNPINHPTFKPIDIRINNCTIAQYDLGIYVDCVTAQTITISNCHIHNIRNSAIYASPPNGDLIIANNQFFNVAYNSTTGYPHIKLDAIDNAILTGNLFTAIPATTIGIIEWQGTNNAVTLTSNIIDSNGASVVDVLQNGSVSKLVTAGNVTTSASSPTNLDAVASECPIRLVNAAQNTVNQTSRDFTEIPSWARRVTLLFHGVSTTGASNLLIQLGVGTVPTTTGYANAQSVFSYASGILTATSSAGIPIYNNAANYKWTGHAVIERIEQLSNNWLVTVVLTNIELAPCSLISSGMVSLSGPLGMVRVTTVSGAPTFNNGYLNISWE